MTRPNQSNNVKTTSKDSSVSKNSRHPHKSWSRRSRQSKGSTSSGEAPANKTDSWKGMIKKTPPIPPGAGSLGPFNVMGKMPPFLGKHPPTIPGGPMMPIFPFMNPMMYQNFVLNRTAKPEDKVVKEKRSEERETPTPKLPPGVKVPFPIPKVLHNMPMMAIPPPGVFMPGSFMPVGVNFAAMVSGNMNMPQDRMFKANNGLVHQGNKSRQQNEKIEPDSEGNNGTYTDHVHLGEVSALPGVGNPSARNLETMSVISDEDNVQEDDTEEKSHCDGKLPENITPGDGDIDFFKANIAFVNSFVPSPPERYRRNYKLHEIKMFSPLGLKAHAKAMGLKPEMLSGFESGPVRSGKLVLLLDLDNTLLHAASQARLDMLDIQISHFVDELRDPELYKFSLPNFANVTYYMKLRPGIREFLQILSLYYEMSIYTNATKEYADVVISILDPDRSLFMDRIVARTNVGERDLLKTASRLYPNLNRRFIVSFDDRKDVWADIPHRQVVKAEHYDFFDSYLNELSDAYGITGGSLDLGNAKCSTMDCDRHLQYMVNVFLELHQRFFKDPFNANVGDILENMQSEVLSGVGILLTGYRKNAKPQPNVLQADCEQRQKEIALELGATVLSRLSDKRLTHVVAGKNCTDNIIKSRDPMYSHVYKVHTLWLYSCRSTWKKMDAEKFDVDNICEVYDNEPPSQPCKDHWKLLRSESTTTQDCPLALEMIEPCLESELPTRIFMGTGAYSHGTELISPFEKIIIRWDPNKTKLLQNSAAETCEGKNLKQIILENAPYTNSVNPDKYVM